MIVIYVDEVGYGSISGPVMSCAVALDENSTKIDGVKDSKKLTKLKREKLYPILANSVLHAFGSASPREIEKLNIHWARYESMRIAVERLIQKGITASKVIVDGKFTIPNLNMKQEAVIKADDKFWQVGAASILAKVQRDSLMSKLADEEEYSHYDWKNNAGYYTPKHRMGVILHGPTDMHRRNFGYFKYCMYCHQKYKEFLRDGKTAEEYFQYEKDQEKCGKSFYMLWKTGAEDLWKEIPYGARQ